MDRGTRSGHRSPDGFSDVTYVIPARRRVLRGLGVLAVAAGVVASFGAGEPRSARNEVSAAELGLEDLGKTTNQTGAGGLRIAAAALPKTNADALRILRRVRARSPRSSVAWRDTDYVLRLTDRYLRANVPLGRRRTVARTLRVNAWWYARHGAPDPKLQQGLTLREPDGLLSSYWGGRGFAVNPVGTTGRWFGLNRDVSAVGLAEALLPLGVKRTYRGTTYLIWEYYDVPDRPGIIRPGASGMAQGRVAQVMSIAYSQTGDQRFATSAAGALESFEVPVNSGGVRSMLAYPAGTRASPWFVERAYPGASPWQGAALNGFMVSLLNLNASATLLGRQAATGTYAEGAQDAAALARRLADRATLTLQRYLPLHDSGSWSYYGMLTPGHKWRTHKASLNYHCYHVRLLRSLEGVLPGHTFGAYAGKWMGYVTRSGQVCAN